MRFTEIYVRIYLIPVELYKSVLQRDNMHFLHDLGNLKKMTIKSITMRKSPLMPNNESLQYNSLLELAVDEKLIL